MLAADNTAVVGFADHTLEEIAYCIVEPGFERMTDGGLCSPRTVCRPATRPRSARDYEVIGIEVASLDPAVAAWLFEQTMRRAREMGRDHGHAEITVDAFVRLGDVRRSRDAPGQFRCRGDRQGPSF
jgi:mycothiol synthase